MALGQHNQTCREIIQAEIKKDPEATTGLQQEAGRSDRHYQRALGREVARRPDIQRAILISTRSLLVVCRRVAIPLPFAVVVVAVGACVGL